MKAQNTALNLQGGRCGVRAEKQTVLWRIKGLRAQSNIGDDQSSPVFDSTFFGDLKEGAVVNIICEFLQFFYMDEIQLTFVNIFEVIKLIEKYDV